MNKALIFIEEVASDLSTENPQSSEGDSSPEKEPIDSEQTTACPCVAVGEASMQCHFLKKLRIKSAMTGLGQFRYNYNDQGPSRERRLGAPRVAGNLRNR